MSHARSVAPCSRVLAALTVCGEPTAGMFPSFTAGSELALRRSFLPPNLVLLHPPPLTFLPCAPAAIPTSKRRRLHSYANHISGAAAMRGSRMRPVVKVEDGVGG